MLFASDCRSANNRTRPRLQPPAARMSKQRAPAARLPPSPGRAPDRHESRGCGTALNSRLQRLPQVFDQILSILNPAREPDHVVGNAEPAAVVGWRLVITHD